MDSSLFKGFILGVSIKENIFLKKVLKGIRPGLEECTLLQAFERCGGLLVDLEDATERMKATHVVARHVRQDSYIWGNTQGKTVVNCLWIWDCLRLQKVFPTRDQIYQPFPGEGIFGAEGCYVTITGYISHQRHIVQHTIESLGMGLMLEMKPGRCTHVIAADVADKTSRKVMAARGEEFKHRIKVVNTSWLYDCARNWDILPADEYLDNPPSDQDPVQGAPLVSLSEGNTVANTPEKSSGISQDTPLPEPRAPARGEIAEAHHPGSLHKNTEASHEDHSLSPIRCQEESAKGGTAHPGITLPVEQVPLTTSRDRGVFGDPVRASFAPRAQEVVPEEPSTTRGVSCHTPGAALEARRDSPGPLEDHLMVLTTGRREGCTSGQSPSVNLAADGGSVFQKASGRGLKPSKSSGRVATRFSPAEPMSEHPPTRLSHPVVPHPSSSPQRTQARGQSPYPGGAQRVEAPGQATASFAPVTAADLYGSEVAFGCDDLGAAEAIAGQLAYQLGPSLDFGPEPPGGSPLSMGSISPRPAASPPPAKRERIPLSELAPGAVHGDLQGSIPLPQRLEGTRASRSGTPLLLQHGISHPKTAVKDKLGGPRSLSKPRGRVATSSRSDKKSKEALALQDINGQQTAANHDNLGMESSDIPVSAPSGHKRRRQEGLASALPARARRKLGAPNPLLVEMGPADNEQPSPVQASVARDSRRQTLRASARGQRAKGSAASKTSLMQGRKRSWEAADEACENSLPAAATVPSGAKPRGKRQIKEACNTARTHDADASGAVPEAGLVNQRYLQQALSGEADGVTRGGPSEGRGTVPAAQHTPGTPADVRWCAALSSGPKCRSTAPERHRPHRALVLLSGMHTEEQRQNLRALSSQGITCISGKCERWPNGVTHIVEPQLSRSMKTLAGLACGAWLVSTAFVGACQASCGLVEADNYELQTGKAGIIDGTAPKHWRLRCGLLGTGAFHGLQVTLFGKIGKSGGPSRSALATIIKAGGGEICSIQHALRHGAHLAIMEADTVATDANIKRLLALQVTCVSPLYVVEWLARPWSDLASHVLFGSKAVGTLAVAENQRGRSADAAALQDPASPSL
eukprot:jgi/Botrbrau1/20930/Bobra.0135s0060.1